VSNVAECSCLDSKFKVTLVPTGIKTGVLTSLCKSFIRPTRAFVVEHLAMTLNVSGGFAVMKFGQFWSSFYSGKRRQPNLKNTEGPRKLAKYFVEIRKKRLAGIK
jgi:hypothetical protein